MTWGKLAITFIAVASLTACAPQTPTPKPKASVSVAVQTGDVAADSFIAVLNASCERIRTDGVSIEVVGENETIISRAETRPDTSAQEWNMATVVAGKYSLGGWIDGDPVCNEALYAERLTAESVSGKDFSLTEVKPGVIDWSIQRQSSSFDSNRFTVANGLVSQIEWPASSLTFKVSYGPLPKNILSAMDKALVDSGQQYMPIASVMFGMTEDAARAYATENGLSIVIAEFDEYGLPVISQPGDEDFNPKRMNLDFADGTVTMVLPG